MAGARREKNRLAGTFKPITCMVNASWFWHVIHLSGFAFFVFFVAIPSAEFRVMP
jgi:hypothetical protein